MKNPSGKVNTNSKQKSMRKQKISRKQSATKNTTKSKTKKSVNSKQIKSRTKLIALEKNIFQLLFEHMQRCVVIYEAKANGKDFPGKDGHDQGRRYTSIDGEDEVGI